MMKLIILAVLGLVVGLGGGSAVAVMRAKSAYAADAAARAKIVADSLAEAESKGSHGAAAPDSTHAASDSSGTDGEGAHGEGGNGAGKATASAGGHGTEAPAPKSPPTTPSVKPKWNRAVETMHAPASGAAAPNAGSHAPATGSRTAPSASTAKVAKIFAAMSAKDAAKVLEHLDDADVQTIIGSVSEKQAAAILQSFPPERAAKISKAVLRAGVAKS